MLTKKSSVFIRLLFSLIAISLLLALAPAALAQTKTFHWVNWDIDVALQPDGSLNVTETQTLNFMGAPFTFGFRSIPVGRAGNNDGIANVSVSEADLVYTESGSNAPGTFEVVEQGDEAVINWYFEPALGPNTYTFSYTVLGAVRAGTSEQGSGDQIFWTVLPSDHPSRVDSSRTTITLPEGVYPQKYTGTEDYLVEAYLNDTPTDDVQITVSDDERVITYETLRPIMPGEKLDVRVQVPHGLLPAETPAWQASEQRDDVVGLGVLGVSLFLLVAGPLGVVLLWYLRGRDPQLGIVVPDYLPEPPEAVPPALVGALIDEKVDMQDILSTMVDLAHRGYILMEEEKRGYNFTRTDKVDSGLREYERTFLNRVFRGENSRSLSSLQNKFYSAIPELKRQIEDALVKEGYVPRSPQSVRTSYSIVAAFVLVLGFASLFLLGFFLGDNAGLGCFPMLAIMLTAVALFIAARHMPRKTAKGAEAAAKWNAFKTYLKNIRQYADVESSGEIFEKYLAYAIAFGQERSFISTFAQSPTAPIPPWYTPYPAPMHGPLGGGMGPIFGGPRPGGTPAGPGGSGGGMPSLGDISGGLTGGLSGMSAGLTRMLNSANTVMRSTPPPSNAGRTGSFGGGGFSGGHSGGFSGGSSGGGGRAGFG